MNIVHNCDCMEFMATCNNKKFDLAIVDPPYGLKATNFVTARRKKRKDKKWNNEIPTDFYFQEIYRISKNTIIWGCNYFGNNIRDVGRIVFNKLMTSKKGPLKLSDCDLASVSIGNRIMYFQHQWSGNVQHGKMNCKNIEDIRKGIERRIHPTQKPVALYEWILKNYGKPGQIIFDSHVGSGSIRIACYDLGFNFVGCELDEGYWNDQEERYNNHIRQGELFEKEEYQELIFKNELP